MRSLIVLFLAVPFIEIYVLLKASDFIGSGWTILAVIATAIIGASLVKKQGVMTLQSAQSKLNNGALPAMEMAEGMAIFLAGALLLTPGFVTDAFGFACLIPPLRQLGIRKLLSSGMVNVRTAGMHGSASNANSTKQSSSGSKGNAIEGEYRDLDE